MNSQASAAAAASVDVLDVAAAGQKRPAAAGERPATTGERPVTAGERPATIGERPATTGERPAAGEGPAAAGNRPVAGEEERPATAIGEQPAARLTATPWGRRRDPLPSPIPFLVLANREQMRCRRAPRAS